MNVKSRLIPRHFFQSRFIVARFAPGGGEKGGNSERGERVANGPNFYPAITERVTRRVRTAHAPTRNVSITLRFILNYPLN